MTERTVIIGILGLLLIILFALVAKRGDAMPNATMNRGTCSVCEKDIAITLAGLVRVHWKDADAPRVATSPQCEGTGKPPKGA